MAEAKINQLPVRTWHWLGMNECALEGEDAQRFEGAHRERDRFVSAKPNARAEHVLQLRCDDGEAQRREVELIAEENSALTVWMDISSEREAEAALALVTRIRAGRHSKVRLVQVQLLGERCRFLNDVHATCGDGASVALLQLFLGGGKTWAAFQCGLNGPESSVSVELGYWLRGSQRLDMNYVALHEEKRTKSQMLAGGVLDGDAFKLFRGTIDFKRGSSGSEGTETEEVLMLNEAAVNQTIPLILCGEEDVQGNHGATVGETDEDVLFYLASRGIERAAAVNLLARMKIEALSAHIGNAALEERVHGYLEEVTKSGESA